MSATADGKQGVEVNWNQIATKWLGLTERLKAASTKLLGAIKGEWLAKLRLKDHYPKKGARS